MKKSVNINGVYYEVPDLIHKEPLSDKEFQELQKDIYRNSTKVWQGEIFTNRDQIRL